jgi:NADP-dependent 3-hydroxy acid dehydrogenase YdfG
MKEIGGWHVVITGAGRGIGFATAEAMLAHGARVTIGDRDLPVLHSAVTALSAHGSATGHPVEVADPQSFAAFIDRAREDHGPIDVLVNNAGVMPIGHFLDQSVQAERTAIEVNLAGVLTGCRLVLPEMVARRHGHIVNIASLAGVVPVPGQVVYAGTKAAVVGLSSSMADEFASSGVEVSVVLPPFTATDLVAGTTTPAGSKAVAAEVIADAVVGVLKKPRTHVVVPYSMRFIGPLMSMLGPRGRRWLNGRFGSDRAFLDFDVAARQAYAQRAETATGLVTGPESP